MKYIIWLFYITLYNYIIWLLNLNLLIQLKFHFTQTFRSYCDSFDNFSVI